jgi:hypothetical protein
MNDITEWERREEFVNVVDRFANVGPRLVRVEAHAREGRSVARPEGNGASASSREHPEQSQY